ncbi:AAA family ATPase [Pontiellaceae bacterium B12227]|nr:AAA family ATPase [Pontiellaceae bacterium B12227]
MKNTDYIAGRGREKAILQQLTESADAELLAVYGRRRVGKTFLITRYFSKFAFEFTGTKDLPVKQQLANFASAFGCKETPPNWQAAFLLLRKKLEKSKSRRKQVVFFDELPWIASRRSGFLPAFEHFWNSWGSRQSNLLFIICGSAAAWMIKRVIHDKGGLHGRVTRTMQLAPFNLHETHEYLRRRGFPDNPFQTLELYMAMGGIPHYLHQAQPHLSAAQNIDALCFEPGAPLRDEFNEIYASLFENHERHLQIIRALAKVQQGLSRVEIQKKTKLRTGGTLTQTLEELNRSGFIGITIPFGRTQRDALYRLTDEFSLFHQRWIHGKKQPEGGGNHWLQLRPTPRWNTWSGFAFENVCLKHVRQIKAALGIASLQTESSAWRHQPKSTQEKGAQIDLLIDRADGVVNLCEMKYSAAPFAITKKYAEELRNKLQVFQSATKTRKALFLTMVTTNGLADNAYSQELVNSRLEIGSLFES